MSVKLRQCLRIYVVRKCAFQSSKVGSLDKGLIGLVDSLPISISFFAFRVILRNEFQKICKTSGDDLARKALITQRVSNIWKITNFSEQVTSAFPVTLWHPAGLGDFRQKKHLNARGFAHEYLRSCSL